MCVVCESLRTTFKFFKADCHTIINFEINNYYSRLSEINFTKLFASAFLDLVAYRNDIQKYKYANGPQI